VKEIPLTKYNEYTEEIEKKIKKRIDDHYESSKNTYLTDTLHKFTHEFRKWT
jgi:hypothetical protein